MQARLRTQPHLEYRPSGFHWRRRWPRRVLAIYAPENIQNYLLFSLRSHVIPDSRALAQKLTLLSDVAFAGVTESNMAIAPDIMDRLLVELCRFLIEAADVAREAAPARSFETAAYELACANAALESLRTAIATRDREMARDPLRDVTEDLVHDPRDGHIVNHNLAEYHVPVNLDVPQIDVMFLEERDAYANPLQSKGIGELGISGAGAAITNAIFNATGVRVRDYPATLDKVFGGIKPN